MTNPKLTYKQLEKGYRAGMASGRFEYRPRSGYLWCTFCGRYGGGMGRWMEDCILGHPYVCACGRVFASKQGIAAHRRTSAGHRVAA